MIKVLAIKPVIDPREKKSRYTLLLREEDGMLRIWGVNAMDELDAIKVLAMEWHDPALQWYKDSISSRAYHPPFDTTFGEVDAEAEGMDVFNDATT